MDKIIKNNIAVKSTVSGYKKYNELVNFIVDRYFSEPNDTSIIFSAARGRLAKIYVFFTEFVEGLELEEDLTDIDKLDFIVNQDLLMNHYYRAVKKEGMLKDLFSDVDTMVTYYNDRLLKQNNTIEEKILEYLSKVNEQFSPKEQAELARKMAASNFDLTDFSSKIEDMISKRVTTEH